MAQNAEALNRGRLDTNTRDVRIQIGGPERDQTADLVVANDALYQLSYRPLWEGRFWAIAARE